MSHIHMIKKLQAKANSGKGEIFQRMMFGRAESLEIKIFDSGRFRKIYMTLIVCGQMMKEMTRECLHPITKILLIEEIIIVEVMQEMDLLKGMDQAFRMNCRWYNLKG